MMTESYLLTLTGLEPVCVVDQAGLRLRETHLVMKLGLKVFTAMPGWKHFFCLVLSALTGWTDFFFFLCIFLGKLCTSWHQPYDKTKDDFRRGSRLVPAMGDKTEDNLSEGGVFSEAILI